MTINKSEYIGITYPKLFSGNLRLKLWKKFMCSRNRHLFDEVWSLDDHCLYCDACNLIVNIGSIDETYVYRAKIK